MNAWHLQTSTTWPSRTKRNHRPGLPRTRGTSRIYGWKSRKPSKKSSSSNLNLPLRTHISKPKQIHMLAELLEIIMLNKGKRPRSRVSLTVRLLAKTTPCSQRLANSECVALMTKEKDLALLPKCKGLASNPETQFLKASILSQWINLDHLLWCPSISNSL